MSTDTTTETTSPTEETIDKAERVTRYIKQGDGYRIRGEFNTALEWYEKSLELAISIDNKEMIAGIYNNIGATCKGLGKRKEAFENFVKCASINKESGDLYNLAKVESNIAQILLEMSNRVGAKSHAQESAKTYKQLKLEKEAANIRRWMNINRLG